MRCFSTIGFLAFPACFAWAGAREGAVLEYQLKVRLTDEPAWVEGDFRVVAAPPVVTHNKAKKRRMAAWRLEPCGGPGAPLSSALLFKAGSLMYFSGPSPEVIPLTATVLMGGRSCRLWQVPATPGVAAYAYLAEVAPGLLALSYLSASLRGGPIADVELHLVKAELGTHPCPAEEGAVLLKTLKRWSVEASVESGRGSQASETVESEEID